MLNISLDIPEEINEALKDVSSVMCTLLFRFLLKNLSRTVYCSSSAFSYGIEGNARKFSCKQVLEAILMVKALIASTDVQNILQGVFRSLDHPQST